MQDKKAPSSMKIFYNILTHLKNIEDAAGVLSEVYGRNLAKAGERGKDFQEKLNATAVKTVNKVLLKTLTDLEVDILLLFADVAGMDDVKKEVNAQFASLQEEFNRLGEKMELPSAERVKQVCSVFKQLVSRLAGNLASVS